jgi:REP element-mobilizing transposase RayT
MQQPTNRPYPHKNIRLDSWRYVGRSSHFVTICCDGRRRLFANPARAAWLLDILQLESSAHRFVVSAYCVMPDHFHMLVSGLDEGSDLLGFVESLKRASEYQFRSRERNRTRFERAKKADSPTEKRSRTALATVAATTAKPAIHPLWQKKFHDHILRERDNAIGVAGYIWMNPVRAGICADPRDYPHSGSFVITDWKKQFLPAEQWAPDWKAK